MAEALANLLNQIAEKIKDSIVNVQRLRNEEITYYKCAYIIFHILNSGISGVCPPADIQDVLLPLSTRCIGCFAFGVTLERNINNSGTVNHAGQLLKVNIEREFARRYNISVGQLRKIIEINVSGNTLTIMVK